MMSKALVVARYFPVWLALVLTACTGTGSSGPGASGAPATQSSATASQPSPQTGGSFQPRVEVVAQNLEVPWALAFAPDGRLFFTERTGRVRVLNQGQLAPAPVATLPVAAVQEAGLMGLALDPGFAQNGFMYVMYTYRDRQGQLKDRVSRLTERAGQASGERVLLDDLPAGGIHDGGRLKFGPDAKLYITQGETGQPALAQRQDSLGGKILRINPDGSIPTDNPFPGSPIYSLGHRNPQGLAWHPNTGALFSTEHGPQGNDEFNLIEAGKNYGWPDVQAKANNPRFVDPLLVFSPAIAPSGATFYQGDALSAWKGNLFFATLRGEHLHRVVLKAPDFRQVERDEILFQGIYGRLRDVIQGPNGALYVATNNRDGRGQPKADDDRILRIVPGS